MSDPNDTLHWYHENAEAFLERTQTVEMPDLYRRFVLRTVFRWVGVL